MRDSNPGSSAVEADASPLGQGGGRRTGRDRGLGSEEGAKGRDMKLARWLMAVVGGSGRTMKERRS